MKNYIDGFVLPIPRIYIDEYKIAAEKIAEIWKEYGAIAYNEYIGDDLYLDGTKSFITTVEAKVDEVIIFGWVVFPSKEIRDFANKKVLIDPRIDDLVAPLTNPKRIVFDGSRMVYGGFHSLVQLQE